MKKQVITGIAIIACVALCATVWPRIAEDGKVSTEPIKPAVIAEIEAGSEEKAPILLSADTHVPEPEAIVESKAEETDITAEEKTQKPESTPKVQSPKPSTSSSEPHMGDTRVINGEKQIYVLGFGWIKDEGGSQGTMVGNLGDELTGNKVGQMGGGTTVGSKGDINKQVGIMGASDAPPPNNEPTPGTKKYIEGKLHVWIPGFGWIKDNGGGSIGIVAEDMYENGNKIGSMGGEAQPVKETTTPTSEQPEPTGDGIHIVFVEVPEKNSTPPPRTAEQEIIIHYRDIGVVGAFAEEAEKIAEQRQRQTA